MSTTNEIATEPAYGSSSQEERLLWAKALDTLTDSQGNEAIAAEVRRMQGAACNYATGWYDAIKGGLDQKDRDRMFLMIWPFAEEVGRAYFLFLTQRISARMGHALAWEQALRTLKPVGNDDALG